MKRICLILTLILATIALYASTDSLYQSAIDTYEKGLYEESLNSFREVLNRGVESPLLYYNMGNAAYRSNNLGYAILYFEKALKMDPGFDDAAYNLQFVNQYKSDVFETVPEFFLRKWIRMAVTGLSGKVWALLALLTFFLLLTGVLFYVFARRMSLKKAGFYTALFMLLFSIFSFYAANFQHREIVEPDKAIIIAPSVTVKSSPSESGNDLFILHEGTRIEIEEKVSEWWSIRIVDGRTGWVPSDTFLPI